MPKENENIAGSSDGNLDEQVRGGAESAAGEETSTTSSDGFVDSSDSKPVETGSEPSEEQDAGEVKTGESGNGSTMEKVDIGVVVGPEGSNDPNKEVVRLEGDKTSTERFPDDEEGEYTPEEFEKMMEMYEPTLKDMKEGSIVKGKVIKVFQNEVLVDVGLKSEGVVQRSEFKGAPVEEGDEIEVFIESVEDPTGMIVLSKQRADFLQVWDKIKNAYDNETIVEGTLKRKIKGGVLVDLYGVEAFLPGSQVALRPVPRVEDLIGQTFEFMIIKLNKRRRNIVVSRRMVLEKQQKNQRDKVLSSLEKNQIREGVVKNITDFGAFIDLGGIDGLLHITDMSWGRIKDPHEVLSIGEKIQVKVLDFNKERQRISLGLKQLTPYPWENVEEKYKPNSKVTGKVVSITDYGAFIELEKGVEGLVHISEMSWKKNVKHPSHVLTVGDEVEAIVLNVNREQEKISLGLKQITPDPWDDLEKRYPVGTVIHGTVRNLTSFGIFVEIEEGIDGLVHISDMHWVKKIRNPSELVKKGDEVDVKILHIDKVRRRVSLGMKQLTEDPWPAIAVTHGVGIELEAPISRIGDRGVYVELDEGAEGFVPVTHLGYDSLMSVSKMDPEKAQKKIEEHFSVGEKIPLRVIEVNHKERKIVLSVKEYLAHKEEIELERFIKKHGKKDSMTLKSIIGDQLENAAAEIARNEREMAEKEAEKNRKQESDTAKTAEQEETVSEDGEAAEESKEASEEEKSITETAETVETEKPESEAVAEISEETAPSPEEESATGETPSEKE